MTGQDLLFWLDDIWFDLAHFQQADVWSLAFRLVVLVVVAVVLWGLAKSFLKTVSRGFIPIWRIITAPSRRLRMYSRTRKHRKEQRKQQEAWEQEKREQEARNSVLQEERERKSQEELEHLKKMLSTD